jgi:hypothetical protein
MTKFDDANIVANSLWEKARIFVDETEVRREDLLWLIREGENKISVEAPSELGEELRMGLGENGGLQLVAEPLFNSPVQREGGRFNWVVKLKTEQSGCVSLVFYNATVSMPWERKCLVMSADLRKEAEVTIGDKVAPVEGSIFYSDIMQNVTLSPHMDSPLNTLRMALERTINTPALSVESDPLFGTWQRDFSWDVTARGEGDFIMCFYGEGMPRPYKLELSRVVKSKVWDLLKVEVNWHWVQDEKEVHVLPDSRSSNSLKFQAKTPDLVGESLVLQLRDGYIPNGAKLAPIIPQYIRETHGAEWHVSFERFVTPGKFSILVFFENRPDLPHEMFFEIVNV